jgi:hypothetical protein
MSMRPVGLPEIPEQTVAVARAAFPKGLPLLPGGASPRSVTTLLPLYLRAGVEGTINQALDITGIRRARYRGLPKVRPVVRRTQ